MRDRVTTDNTFYFIGNDMDREEIAAVVHELNQLGHEGRLVHPNLVVSRFTAEGATFVVDGVQIRPALVVGWVFEEVLLPGIYLLYAMERSGIPVVNNAQTLFCGQNKYLCSEALHRCGIPHFSVLSGFGEGGLEALADSLSFPLVGKPIVGFGGGCVIRMDSADELKNHARLLAGFKERWYVQPYMTKRLHRDLRVVCIDYQAVYAYYRYAAPGRWVTNLVGGGRGEILDINEELARTAEAASRAVGARISGVDLAEDPDGGYRVFEVNTCPAVKISKYIPSADRTVEMALARFLVKEAVSHNRLTAR